MADSEMIESTKIRMIAAECALRNLTGQPTSLTPIPGTMRVIVAGTREEVARLVGAQAAPTVAGLESLTRYGVGGDGELQEMVAGRAYLVADVERWAASHAGASAAPAGLDEREKFIWNMGRNAARDEALEEAAAHITRGNEQVRDNGWIDCANERARCAAAIRALINTPAADGGNEGEG